MKTFLGLFFFPFFYRKISTKKSLNLMHICNRVLSSSFLNYFSKSAVSNPGRSRLKVT